jgi:hypothetical protein
LQSSTSVGLSMASAGAVVGALVLSNFKKLDRALLRRLRWLGVRYHILILAEGLLL